MKKTLAVLIFVVLAVSLPTKVFSYDLADDWSNSTNPNGTWSYNEGLNPLSINTSNWPKNEFGPSQTAWANGNDAPVLVPGWMKSVTTPGGEYDWLEGDVIVHSTDTTSGGSQGLANVTWTAPTAGIFDISGELWSGRDIDRSNAWSLFLDTTLLDSGSLFDGDIYSRASPYAFSFLGESFDAGSVLRLTIANTADYGDFVGVNLSVTPEPIAMTLFLIGGIPIGVSLYRKRKKTVKV